MPGQWIVNHHGPKNPCNTTINPNKKNDGKMDHRMDGGRLLERVAALKQATAETLLDSFKFHLNVLKHMSVALFE